MTAGEVADATGLHLSTARAHLERLTGTGLVVRARASGGVPGRPAWRYRSAAPDPAPALYRYLAAALLEHLAASGGDTRAEAALVGERWGRRLAPADGDAVDPVTATLEVLDGLGFDPERRPDPAAGDPVTIHLYTCPFLELVRANPDAMCGLHLGVVRGVLSQCGADAATAVLEPFGAPDACVVRLANCAGRHHRTDASAGGAECAARS